MLPFKCAEQILAFAYSIWYVVNCSQVAESSGVRAFSGSHEALIDRESVFVFFPTVIYTIKMMSVG